VAATEWASARGEHTEPSPFVDWRRFGEWSGFEAHVGQQRAKLLADGRRQTRRLEKELGPVRLSVENDPGVFDQCLAWKSAQYRRTGARDLFADERHVALLRRLVADGIATTESLWAGETLVAAHIGMLHEGRYSWWFPAYDPEHDRFSPGRLLLVALMQSSFERGDAEFDLLLGDEEYKWHFATDVRLVDSVGSPSLSQRIQRLSKRAAHRFPRAGIEAKKIRGRIRARRTAR
jgi:CelD/BcsL family acetyltransferase involved in cellulose biosynthesis